MVSPAVYWWTSVKVFQEGLRVSLASTQKRANMESSCRLLGVAESGSLREDRLLQLHIPPVNQRLSTYSQQTHIHTWCTYIHPQMIGHADQRQQKTQQQWIHPVPFSGWSGWKPFNRKCTYLYMCIHTRIQYGSIQKLALGTQSIQ